MLQDKNILLIISGGIAAYKSLELIRLIRKNNGGVRCILTKAGEQFVTPLSVSSLSQNKVYTDLWSLDDEAEMGHIRLSRECDLIVVAPASADLLAKMAHGFANDLASTCLLASNQKVLIAPAMNQMMWHHPATQENIKTLKERGVLQVGPEDGIMACGEEGFGRMGEPEKIFQSIVDFFHARPLKGKKAIVTSGPTHEPLDPVRFIGNRSSGKQGHAIACALRDAGADVTLVSGPVSLMQPNGIKMVSVQTASEMLSACEAALPAQILVCAAAVADWRPEEEQKHKIKKIRGASAPAIRLTENPDILKTLGNLRKNRPELVIGFAAETENLEQNAQQKLQNKGCDWIIANDVSSDKNSNVQGFDADDNEVLFISAQKTEKWSRMPKKDIAYKLVQHIVEKFLA